MLSAEDGLKRSLVYVTTTVYFLMFLEDDWWVLLLPMIITRPAVVCGLGWSWLIQLLHMLENQLAQRLELSIRRPWFLSVWHKFLTVVWLGSKKQKVKCHECLASWVRTSAPFCQSQSKWVQNPKQGEWALHWEMRGDKCVSQVKNSSKTSL